MGPEKEEELMSELRERITWKEKGKKRRALGWLVQMPHDMAAVGTQKGVLEGLCQSYRY